ncbi:MAG TPA: ATP-binding protein [Pyrinomonadaceae bacterium]|jgi:two-component system phosphate regulon sensor histidine kinase PhoR|nr:ATP-binding protein [Pyrinomonadaceae bacterium]
MSFALRFFLAMCAVGVAGTAVFIAHDQTVGRFVFLVAVAGLLLGVFVARGGRREGGEATRRFVPTYDLSPRAANGQGAAGPVLEATMNAMREGVLVVDGSLRVVSLNRASAHLFGGKEGAAAGRPLSMLTRDPVIHAAYRSALEAGEFKNVKVELSGGERRVLDLHVAPLTLDEGQDSRGAIGVFLDLTELDRLERVRQEFLSNVSHELRTPLTSILAFVETLEGGALEEPDDARRFVSIIRRNAERMRALIEDVMELSSIESGAGRVRPRPLRLRPLAQEALSALAPKAAARGVSLSNEVGADVVVSADPRRLEQMLLNLVDNAVKFGREGGTVSVRHERGARDLISVSDTGEGIPPEHLPRVFERFYRVDPSRSHEQGGTGLGLAIVKHLARAHGGEVSVRSEPGAGSTFTVELPRATTREEESN